MRLSKPMRMALRATGASALRLRGSISVWMGLCCCLASSPLIAQDGQDSLDKLTDKPAVVKDDMKVTLSELRKILRQLESDKAAERDAAEKRLIEIGPAVVPFLPEVSSSTSGEMKIRLERIRKELQTSKIESFFEASRVTLSGKMNVTDALAEIAKQTGNKVSFESSDAAPNKEIELKADKQAFWEVMDDVMIQASLRMNPYSSTEGVVLIPDDTVIRDQSRTSMVRFRSQLFRPKPPSLSQPVVMAGWMCRCRWPGSLA